MQFLHEYGTREARQFSVFQNGREETLLLALLDIEDP
jgi:hypothetical protein